MNIGELKQKADLSYDITVAKRNALERAESRQIMAYNGHLFKANVETICAVETLKKYKQKNTNISGRKNTSKKAQTILVALKKNVKNTSKKHKQF